MIDETAKRIYIDNSTRSTFQSCKEKGRLTGVGYRSRLSINALDFGHAFHAAWAAYYDALAGGWHDADGKWHLFVNLPYTGQIRDLSPVSMAKAAFLRDLQFLDAKLPVNLESAERRSIERGLALIEAYIHRWRDEPYENLLRPSGEPYVEVGFKYYVTTWQDYEVYYVGYIDRLMRNTATQRPCMVEGKTTTQGLSQYIQQCRPNNQITGYFPAAQAIHEAITQCVWDCVFISSRAADMKKAVADRWWMYGIDIDADFKRQVTSRTATDITDFKQDLESDIQEYCQWLTAGAARWPKSTGACHSYGGCQFRRRCSLNILPEAEPSYMDTDFVIAPWEPWRKIVEREGTIVK